MTRAVYAVDFDGTLADMGAAKAAWVRRRLGRELEPWQCDRTTCIGIIGEDAYFAMIDEVTTAETSRGLTPIAGALEALPRLAAVGPVEIVTARRGVQVDWADAWLRAHGVRDHVAALHSAHGTSKIRIALDRGLAWLVDDDARHLDDVAREALAQLHLRVGRMARPPSGGESGRPHAAGSWDEALRLLTPPPAS